jgi:hypothetical protein
LQKKSPGGDRGLSFALRAFLRGVLGKAWRRMWFFRGENVVDCVVNVENF